MQNAFCAVVTAILLLIGVVMGKVFLESVMLIHEISVLLVILNVVGVGQLIRSVTANTYQLTLSIK